MGQGPDDYILVRSQIPEGLFDILVWYSIDQSKGPLVIQLLPSYLVYIVFQVLLNGSFKSTNLHWRKTSQIFLQVPVGVSLSSLSVFLIKR